MSLSCTTIGSLATQVERAISTGIRSVPKNDWRDRRISARWVHAVADLLDLSRVSESADVREVHCRSFWRRDHDERNGGDVAVLVNMVLHEDDQFTGVGLLIGHGRDWSRDAFPSLSLARLRHLRERSRYTTLLLYDHEPIIPATAGADAPSGELVFVQDGSSFRRVNHIGAGQAVPVTYAGVVPTEPMLEERRHNRSAFRYAVPLSHQICFRYLLGFDLDTDAELIERTLHGSELETAPAHILSLGIKVGHSGSVPTPLVPNEKHYARYQPFP